MAPKCHPASIIAGLNRQLLDFFTASEGLRGGAGRDSVRTMSDQPATSPLRRLRAAEKNLWTVEWLGRSGAGGGLASAWRTLVTTLRGTVANQLPQRAAALTYYSLMAVGPVLALALTVSGFILARQSAGGENPAKQALVAAIQYAAPQVAGGASGAHPTLAQVNRELDAMVDRLLANAANGTAGAIGLGIVILLAVLMLGRVEDALNATWKAEKGRPWSERFARYCLFLVLFFLLGSASLAVFSIGAIVERAGSATAGLAGWAARLPGGERLVEFLRGAGPELVTLGLLAAGLASLYRFLPNARVRWTSAWVGGLAAGALILGNQMLAAAYIGKVLEFRTLYGELGIVPVLMFGGYVSWLILLVGGQVACSHQHRRALTGKGWDALSHRARRSLAFVCLTETLRRHRAGEGGPTPSAIAETARMPLGAVDACLARLHALGLLAPARLAGVAEPVQVPARPIEQLTVGEVWRMIDSEADGELEDASGPAACCPRLETLTSSLLAAPEACQRLGDLA